jgi:restriction system protein
MYIETVPDRNSPPAILLRHGWREGAELMIDHEVGVASRVLKVPKIDSDYFDDEGSA